MSKDLGDVPFRYAHSWEINHLPSNFSNYALTEIMPYQLLIHDSFPIVGTQFHPEYYTDKHPAGLKLIENSMDWTELRC